MQHQLMQEKRNADQEMLLSALRSELGFVQDRPVAAVLIFRCCLQWKAFQAVSSSLFDRIDETITEQVDVLKGDNSRLAYWLTNAVSLLHLLKTYVKPTTGSPTKRRHSTDDHHHPRNRTSEEEEAVPGQNGANKVQANYPAMLFKQHLDAFVQKIFPMLRDNVRNEISLHLSYCIHDPILRVPGSETVSEASTPAAGATPQSSAAAAAAAAFNAPDLPKYSESWKNVLAVFDNLLNTLCDNHVPPYLARKLFEQLFACMNVVLFNQMLLRRECCSFTNGVYVSAGLEVVEQWTQQAGQDWVGNAWDELLPIRQAIALITLEAKETRDLSEILDDVCPALSSKHLYRISTLYWDDTDGTEGLSHELQSALREMAEEGMDGAEHSNHFLLDDELTLPFKLEDINGLFDGKELLGMVPVPPELDDSLSFMFLRKDVDLSRI